MKHASRSVVALAFSTLLTAVPFAVQAQDKVIRIGVLMPISGPGSYFGVMGKEGIDLALEQMANERAMERAATRAGKDKDTLLKEEVEKRASVSDEEVQKYYDENKDKLKLVPIDDEKPDNGAGPISPSAETVRNGTYRPLSRPIFIYLSVKALERPEVRQFAQYYAESASPLISEVGYVPLTDTEQQLVRDRLSAGTTGTIFEPGVPINPQISLEQRLKGQR